LTLAGDFWKRETLAPGGSLVACVCGAPAARPGAATAALSDISKWDDHWQSVLMLYVLGPGPPG